jgi:hypothetical protein
VKPEAAVEVVLPEEAIVIASSPLVVADQKDETYEVQYDDYSPYGRYGEEGNEVSVEAPDIDFEDFQDVDLDADVEVSVENSQVGFDVDAEIYNDDGNVYDYEIVVEDGSQDYNQIGEE